MPNDPLIEAIARALCRYYLNGGDPDQPAMRWNAPEMTMEPQEFPAWHDYKYEAQAAIAAIRDSGHVILPNDWIRRKMPRIDPGGGGLLNEVPLDEEVHCCQWTLYQERERVNAEFDKLVGIEPPAAALVGRPER